MNNIDWTRWLCRASSLPMLMSEGKDQKLTEKQAETIIELQSKPKLTDKQLAELERLVLKRDAPPTLSNTAKSMLDEEWIRLVTGREKLTDNKYTIKGILAENDSIELYNEVNFTNYTKSDEYLENDYIMGHPDIIDRENKKVIDIKTAFDIFTFFGNKEVELKAAYYWQVVGYCIMLGYSSGSIVYTLINTPEQIIMNEQYSATYRYGDTEVIQKQIEINMKYDDIPANLRIKEYPIIVYDNAYAKIIDKVILARQYLSSLTI